VSPSNESQIMKAKMKRELIEIYQKTIGNTPNKGN